MKVKRSKYFIPPMLTKKDEGVSEGYISMYEMFVLSPKVREIYGENTANELRKKTYKNILKLFNEYGSDDFSKFWNYHIYEITDMGLNEFAKFEKLKEVCFYVRCFQNIKVVNGVKRNMISFGISQSDLEYHVKEKERSLHENTPYIPKKIQNVKYNKNIIDFGIKDIKIGNNSHQKLDNDAILKRFEHWQLLKGYSLKEAIAIAMKKIVEVDPVEGTYNLEQYHVETIFDKQYLVREPKTTALRQFKVNIPGDLYYETLEILERYNRDIENMEYTNKSITEYIIESMRLMNSKMPLKYTDPKKYEAYIKFKEKEKRSNKNEQ